MSFSDIDSQADNVETSNVERHSQNDESIQKDTPNDEKAGPFVEGDEEDTDRPFEDKSGPFVKSESFQKVLTSVPLSQPSSVGPNYPFEVTFQGELREIPGVGTVLVMIILFLNRVVSSSLLK